MSERKASPGAPRTLWTRRGSVTLPMFNPDATYGVVRAIDALDAERCGIQALQMNVFHLMQRPGSSVIRALGGLHEMSGWTGPILTDSGGFQAYSLIRQDPRRGQITDRGIVFRREGTGDKVRLTPEKSMQLQLAYGADILVSLDDCTDTEYTAAAQAAAVERTIAWARRCRRTFDELVRQRRLPPEERPLLFGVVQGGSDPAMRARCAGILLEIGFDGFGFGGWPLTPGGELLEEMLAATRAAIPALFPMHALGVGHPVNIVRCVQLGYEIFDSALPTRDARRGRLYGTREGGWSLPFDAAGEWFQRVFIFDERFSRDSGPIMNGCRCLTCTRYSRAYLRHLFRVKDALALRLATIHNLTFIVDLLDAMRRQSFGNSPPGADRRLFKVTETE